ncbi:MAG: LCP family protein [Chloroflexota bacterium]
MAAPSAPAAPSRGRSPSVATSLSFLWPGLGHWYARRDRAAVVFALPVVVATVALLAQAVGGLDRLAMLVISPSSAQTLLILLILLGVWRVIAMGDSMVGLARGQRRPRRRGLAVFAVLTAVVVLSHAWLGYLAWSVYDAGTRIFVADGPDPANVVVPGGAVASPPPDAEYRASPFATPASRQARVNILLTGIDSAETRTESLTDTLLVASLDPESKRVSLISFPRDISQFPLYNGKTYRGTINSLMTWARMHPDDYPDGPLQTVVKELSFLLGVPIHYFAAVDLQGFRRMVDLVGGVTVDNKEAIDDPRYDWLDGRRGFSLPVGSHKLDGENALAYVRSRYTPGDSDFSRARRQQEVLLALRAKLASPTMLPRLPDVVQAAGDTVRTNLPSDRLSEMLGLARTVDDEHTTRVVLGPPYSVHPPNEETGGIYILRLDMDRLMALSVKLFGADSAYAPRAGVSAPGASPGSSGR